MLHPTLNFRGVSFVAHEYEQQFEKLTVSTIRG